MKIISTLLLVLLSLPSFVQDIPEFIKVEGGTFAMGDEWGIGESNEQPTHLIRLSEFYIGKTEVTVAQYRKYCEETGVSMPKEPSWGWKDNDPIVNVNWYDAINYCDWLSEKLDQNITLPTEAQWEYAARGGNISKEYKYSGARSADAASWYENNSGNKVNTVATKKPNELGLYDMSGNVWEWCLDWYSDVYYRSSPWENPRGPASGRDKVLRGGSWYDDPFYCRVARRLSNKPNYRYINRGFRVVRNP